MTTSRAGGRRGGATGARCLDQRPRRLVHGGCASSSNFLCSKRDFSVSKSVLHDSLILLGSARAISWSVPEWIGWVLLGHHECDDAQKHQPCAAGGHCRRRHPCRAAEPAHEPQLRDPAAARPGAGRGLWRPGGELDDLPGGDCGDRERVQPDHHDVRRRLPAAGDRLAPVLQRRPGELPDRQPERAGGRGGAALRPARGRPERAQQQLRVGGRRRGRRGGDGRGRVERARRQGEE
eukprot:SAG22_NODE_1066_length_5744_cov_7.937290_1_plen_236_part_00